MPFAIPTISQMYHILVVYQQGSNYLGQSCPHPFHSTSFIQLSFPPSYMPPQYTECIKCGGEVGNTRKTNLQCCTRPARTECVMNHHMLLKCGSWTTLCCSAQHHLGCTNTIAMCGQAEIAKLAVSLSFKVKQVHLVLSQMHI